MGVTFESSQCYDGHSKQKYEIYVESAFWWGNLWFRLSSALAVLCWHLAAGGECD